MYFVNTFDVCVKWFKIESFALTWFGALYLLRSSISSGGSRGGSMDSMEPLF